MANVGFTYAVASILSATASIAYASSAVSHVKASAVASPQTQISFTYSIPSTETKISAVASPQTRIHFDYFIIPMTNIPSVGVTASDVFTVEVSKISGDEVTVTELAAKTFTKGNIADSVTVQDTSFRSFTSNVDFDLSDSDVDPDPINISDAQVLNPQLIKVDSLSVADTQILNPQLINTDSVSISDSSSVYFILPDLYVYPDSVTINDGDIGGFIMRTTEPYTGVIGAPGYIGQVIVNDDKITTGDDFTGLSTQLS